MAVNASTNETYDVSTIREDLAPALASISPTETIFMSTIGTRNVDNTYFEWSEVDLAAAAANRQIEGDVGLSNTAPTNAVRKGNYTQISAKVVEVSSTNQAVNGVADAQTVAKQVAYKLSEMKRDMEKMLLDNVAGSAGASGTARQTAGLPAFFLAPMIEEGFFNQEISLAIIKNYLSNKNLKEIDSLILACTHYPLIKKQIIEYYNNQVEVIDSSSITANYIKNELEKMNMLNTNNKSSYNFIVSNLTESFSKSASFFFKDKISLQELDIWK